MALSSFICVSTPNSFSRSVTHVVLPASRVEEVVDLATPQSIITTGLTLEDVRSAEPLIQTLIAKNPDVRALTL